MASVEHRIPHPLWIALAGVVVGAAFGVLAVRSWTGHQALSEAGVVATGTVVDTTQRRWRTVATVEFTTGDGRTARSRINGGTADELRIGDRITVRYDPREPDGRVYDARVSGQGDGIWMMGGLALVGLLGAPMFAWFVVRPAHRHVAAGRAATRA